MNYYYPEPTPTFTPAKWERLLRGQWLQHINGGRCQVICVNATTTEVSWGGKNRSTIHKDNINNYKHVRS